MTDMYTGSRDERAETLDNEDISLDGQKERETFHHDSLPRLGHPIKKLANRRWYGPILTPAEEADLLRKAQAGDKVALTTLLQKLHRAVLKIAKRAAPDPAIERQARARGLTAHDGPELDDLVAAGMAELTKAIFRFNPRRNNGLYAYAKKYIEGAISAEAKNYKKRGTGGETRLERWIYSHPYDTPEEIVAALSKRRMNDTPEQVAQAQQGVSARRVSEHYSTTDSNYDEDDNFTGSRPAASHDMYRMYDCYGSSPHLRFHNAASRLIDDLAADADTRAKQRLEAIGRRAYALELVDKDHARIAARAGRNSICIGPLLLDETSVWLPPRTLGTTTYRSLLKLPDDCKTARQVRDRARVVIQRRQLLGVNPKSVATTHPRRKSQPRQPQKRYWRSWEENAAVAA